MRSYYLQNSLHRKLEDADSRLQVSSLCAYFSRPRVALIFIETARFCQYVCFALFIYLARFIP